MSDAVVGTGIRTPWPRFAARRKPWVDSTAIALLSVVIFLLNTRHGVGVEPDTTRYMRLGPHSYDAPLYTWVLDAIRFSGLSFQSGAKAFALLLIAINTMLIWRMLRLGSASAVCAAVGTLLITISPQFVGLHVIAMSEAPFLATLLLTVFVFVRYLDGRRMVWLLASGVLLGLAMLARFTAAPMALALAIMLIILPARPAKRRLGDVILLAAVSGALFFGWVIVNKLTGGQGIGRELAFNGRLDLEIWRNLLWAMATTVMPSTAPLPVRAPILIVVLGAVLWLVVKHCQQIFVQFRDGALPASCLVPLIWAIFAALYIPFLILSVAIEADLTFNGRYLLPFYVALVIAGVSAFAWQTARRSARRLEWVLVGSAALMLVSHAIRTAAMTRTNTVAGIGYASTAWRDSPIVRAVAHLPCNAVIYSNAPDALNYLTGRKTNFTPLKVEPRTGHENPSTRARDVVAQIRRRLTAGDGYLVFADRVYWRFYAMSEPEILRALSPPIIERTVDGRIYGPYGARRLAPKPPSSTKANCGDVQ